MNDPKSKSATERRSVFSPPPGKFSFSPVELNFEKMNGLVPFVLQHAYTQQILMLGFLDKASWEISCRTGILTMYRRTLGRQWAMGEDDGNFVQISKVVVDCDDDSVLFETIPERHICGHGYLSCFCREIPSDH